MLKPVLAARRTISGALGSVGGGTIPPYLAGGAPMPLAVYDPMGAANLAASYLRIAGTGGNANLDPAVVGAGVAPTHTPGTGWIGDGTKWLSTGLANIPATYTMLIRFTGWAGHLTYLAGLANYGLENRSGGAIHRYVNGGTLNQAVVTSGVLCVAGDTGYLNGVAAGTIPAGSAPAGGLSIFCRGAGLAITTANIQYFIVYDNSTGHATWVPAVSAAVAAL